MLAFVVSIPYGGVTPTAQLVLRGSVAVALVLAALTKDLGTAFKTLRVALVGLAGLAGLALLQSVSWPARVVALLSPGHLTPVLQQEPAAAGLDVEALPLSLAPKATANVSITVLALMGLLVAAFAAGRHRRYRRWIAAGLLGAALFQVVYGLRPLIAGLSPRLTGTFVNPDHLAVYLELAICVGLAAVWGVVRWVRRESALEVQILAVAGAAALWLVLFVGLLFTGSRAALLAVFVGLAVESVLLAIAWRRKRVGLVAFAVSIGLSVGLLAVTGTRGFGRLVGLSWHEALVEGRLRLWSDATELVAMFPLFGSGLGSFEESFPLVQSESSTRILWGRLHNDFLELLITGGFVGVVLALAVVFGLVVPLVRTLRHGLRTEDRLAAAAVLSALSATATHELFDFGLSLPANSATLAILLGAAIAARLKVSSPKPG